MIVAVVALLLGVSGSETVQVVSLKLDPKAIREAEKVEIQVMEGDAKVVYRGVPLRFLLTEQLKDHEGMAGLRALSDAVIVVRATDDYLATISAAAVAMDAKGAAFLLATERDGQPLDPKQGPFKLIVPGDPEKVRWVRMIDRVELVRMPKAGKSK